MSSCPQFKVIACDLDDTLIRNDETVSDYDIEMLNRAQKAGINIVFSSGVFSLFLAL